MSTTITSVRTVGVPVTDQDRAVEFYVGLLGLEKRLDAPVEQLGGRWIEVAPPDAAMTAALMTVALVPAQPDNPAGGQTGIRLTTADAAALHKQLLDRGATVGELLRWEGIPPMFTLTDPDGNRLEIVEQ